MTRSHRLEQRIDALRYSMSGQSSGLRNGAGQHADAVDEDQIPALQRCEAEPEHPSKVFDTHHFGREYVRHTDRVYEIDHGISPLNSHQDCASAGGESIGFVCESLPFTSLELAYGEA